MFWPDLGPKEAHAALRRDLHDLTTLVARECLNIDRTSISLRQNGAFWTDVNSFCQPTKISIGKFALNQEISLGEKHLVREHGSVRGIREGKFSSLILLDSF